MLLTLMLSVFLWACGGGQKPAVSVGTSETTAWSEDELIIPRHAEGFTIDYVKGGCLLSIHDPQKEKGEGEVYRFALVKDPAAFNRDSLPEDYVVLSLPIRSVVCMTSLQLSGFLRLGALDQVVGITSTRHLFNEDLKQRIADGRIHQIGIEGNFDNEVIMAIAPDLIFISPFKRGGYEVMKEVGIPLMPHLGYKENSPLGQTEWIRLIGLLLGREAEANALFQSIETEYNDLKQLATGVEKRPTVFSGEMRGGNWYAVGGRNFLAQLFRDAGADYFLKDDPNTGGVTLDFETIYRAAAETDYWRILNSYDGRFGYDALKAEDERYADFKAFKNKGVIYCNLKHTPYYEEAPMHPNLLLKDFIKVFHPQLLPDYAPKFYHLLP